MAGERPGHSPRTWDSSSEFASLQQHKVPGVETATPDSEKEHSRPTTNSHEHPSNRTPDLTSLWEYPVRHHNAAKPPFVFTQLVSVLITLSTRKGLHVPYFTDEKMEVEKFSATKKGQESLASLGLMI